MIISFYIRVLALTACFVSCSASSKRTKCDEDSFSEDDYATQLDDTTGGASNTNNVDPYFPASGFPYDPHYGNPYEPNYGYPKASNYENYYVPTYGNTHAPNALNYGSPYAPSYEHPSTFGGPDATYFVDQGRNNVHDPLDDQTNLSSGNAFEIREVNPFSSASRTKKQSWGQSSKKKMTSSWSPHTAISGGRGKSVLLSMETPAEKIRPYDFHELFDYSNTLQDGSMIQQGKANEKGSLRFYIYGAANVIFETMSKNGMIAVHCEGYSKVYVYRKKSLFLNVDSRMDKDFVPKAGDLVIVLLPASPGVDATRISLAKPTKVELDDWIQLEKPNVLMYAFLVIPKVKVAVEEDIPDLNEKLADSSIQDAKRRRRS